MDWKKEVKHSYVIAQGYLSTDPERTVRIRLKGDSAYLTIKGKSHGISRLELEYEIPVPDAEQALLLCETQPIRKERFEVEYADEIWEIDVFEGENAGLVLAEIELLSETAAFELPPWVGEEVSNDHRYFNAYLSKHPFSTWE